MRIAPIQFEIENLFDYEWRKAVITILNIDTPDSNTSLFEIGIYEKEFIFEVFFSRFLYNKIRDFIGI